MQDRQPSNPSVRPVDLLFLAAWFALLGSSIEVVYRITWKWLGWHTYMWRSHHFPWMGPAVNLVIFGLPALILFVLARWAPHRRWLRLALAVYCFLLVALLLNLKVALLPYGISLFLAAGVAIRVSLFLARRASGFLRLARRSMVWMVALLASLTVTNVATPLVKERRALARLPAPPANAPNVLFVVMDTVRAASMSLHGHDRPTTPNIDRFAQRGVVFDRALAPTSWTLPSHASLFTGQYAHDLNVIVGSALNAQYPTLAEVLSGRGYVTAGFVANRYFTTRESGLDRGFCHYADFLVSPGEAMHCSALTYYFLSRRPVRQLLGLYDVAGRKSAEQVNGEFLSWLDGHGDRPFFAFLNYYDAHDPYLPLPPFAEEYGPKTAEDKLLMREWFHVHKQEQPADKVAMCEKAYDGCIAYLDHHIGRLLDDLERRGVLDNTLVVITSDHGEHFGEHNQFLHGTDLYRDSLHVPLVVVHPGKVPAGKRVEDFVSLRDCPATVLDLLGLEGQHPIPGNSLTRCWDDSRKGSPPQEPTLLVSVIAQGCWFLPNHGHSPLARGHMVFLMLDGKYYIRNLGDGREELYDFVDDPREEYDLLLTDNGRARLRPYHDTLKGLFPEHSFDPPGREALAEPERRELSTGKPGG